MRKWITSLFGAAIAGSVGAQPYFMDAFTIDNGGGTLFGPTYMLSSTIGQPDAGVLLGSTYALTGGFWGAVDAGPSGCNAADLNQPFGILDLSDINVFVQGFLTQNAVSDLSPPFGVFDLSDINLFVGAFLAGCP